MRKHTLCRCGALLAGIGLLLASCSGPAEVDGPAAVDGSASTSQSTTGKPSFGGTDATGDGASTLWEGSASSSAGSGGAGTTGNALAAEEPSRTTTAAGGGAATTKAQGSAAVGNTAESLLNSAALKPMRTNCAALDRKVDEIFAQILKPGMSTYDKVKACFDYLVKNGVYAHSFAGGAPTEGILYDSALDARVVALAYGILTTNRGVCDHYSAAFVVMTRAIGLESYYVGGQVRSKGGGYTGHAWVNIRMNGAYYVFDPQVQQNNAGAPYYFFGKTDAQMGDMYQYDDREGTVGEFHSFRYYPEISASITVRSGGKTYQASLSQSSSVDESRVFPQGITVGGDGAFSIDVAPAGGTGKYLCQIGDFWRPGYFAEKEITGSESFPIQMEAGTATLQVAVQNNDPNLYTQDAVIFEFAVTYMPDVETMEG